MRCCLIEVARQVLSQLWKAVLRILREAHDDYMHVLFTYWLFANAYCFNCICETAGGQLVSRGRTLSIDSCRATVKMARMMRAIVNPRRGCHSLACVNVSRWFCLICMHRYLTNFQRRNSWRRPNIMRSHKFKRKQMATTTVPMCHRLTKNGNHEKYIKFLIWLEQAGAQQHIWRRSRWRIHQTGYFRRRSHLQT